MKRLRDRQVHSVVLLAATALAVLLVTGCDEDDIEKRLGAQTAAAVEKEYGVSKDARLQDWANTLGHKMVGQSHRQYIPYSFKVINTDMVNAFAAPYGHIYLTQGFLNFAQSEDEVAFVVAHEVGHVANRDSIKAFKKNILFNIGAALLGSQSETLGQIGGIGAGLVLLHYSRDDERGADIAGSTYSYTAGYDPAGGIAFFERLMRDVEKERPSSMEHLFLTHPETERRIAAEKLRPEMNLNDAAVASRIGRSYGRRYALATASTFYKQALTRKPEAVETRLTLADAYARQGLYDLARTEYSTILQREPSNATATYGLQALGQAPPTYLATSPAEQQQASQDLAAAGNVGTQTNAIVSSSHNYINSVLRSSRDNSSIVRSAISSMMEISAQDKELSERGNEAFVFANGAVSEATEAAYTLESVEKDMTRVADFLRANSLVARTALQHVAGGQGQAGDAAVYHRALTELQAGALQMNNAITEAQAATPDVQRATRLASNTARQLGTMVGARNPDRHIFPVRSLASDTRKAAAQARQGVNKVKRLTAMAECRALLAKLNLAAMGASPEVRGVYDGMVAYYCNVTPDQVTNLRNKGFGFGDAAFVLSAATAVKAPVDSYLGAVNSSQLIDGLRDQDFNFRTALPLLRYLSNALDREIAARA